MHGNSAGLRLIPLTLFAASAVFAQRDLATLVGTVTDPSGGVVTNATVTLTETDTNEVYTLTTNNVGEYIRPALKPSTYSISVTAPGFRKAEQKDIQLRPGERTGVNIQLTVGDIGQTIEVVANAPLLQTESTQIGAALESSQVTDTPLGSTRIFTYLARLSPGVLPPESGARDAAGGGFSANGVRSNGQNNFLLNGVDNNVNVIDFLNATSFSVGPSVDAISEMTVNTQGYNAEYGRAAGAVVNVNIKSGTNQVHGNLFNYLQNVDLNANSWSNNRVGKANPPFIQNQFGGTIGGPIIKNKLFIFGDYQGTQIRNVGFSSTTATVPTAAEISGNFTSILGAVATGTDANGNPITFQKGAIYDPASTVGTGAAPTSRTAFPGNIIPVSRMDPIFSKIISLMPAPNLPVITGTQPTNDYQYSTAGSSATNQGDSRVDYKLSDKSSLFGSVSWSNTNKVRAPPLPGPLDDSGFTGATEYDLNRNGQISYTRVWNPTLVTESRVSFTRLVTVRHDFEDATDEYKAFGIGGYDPTYNYTLNGSLPAFSVGGYQGFGGGGYTPAVEYNNVWDFVQNVAISRGTHAFKMGAEFRSVKFPFFQLPNNQGAISYSANATEFPSTKTSSLGGSVSSETGDGLASALLGQVSSATISTANFISSDKVAYAGYFQDDWKFSQKLTFNLGMRYELWSPNGEQFGRQANFNLQNNTLYIPQGNNCNAPLPPNFSVQFPTVIVDRCHVSNYMIRWDKLDFGPRIGIAWHFANKMVLRLSYGIFYGGEENQGGSPNRGEGVPFNETVTMSATQGISSFIPISSPLCTGCDYIPNGLMSGLPANPFALNAGIKLLGVQPDFDNPLVHKWGLILQRELPWDMALEVGYEGNHQAHQIVLTNSDTYTNLGTTNSAISSGTLQEIQPACPPPTCVSVGNGLSMVLSNGWGNYAAGSAKLDKRFSHGLQFISSYVWSHALANAGTPLSGTTAFMNNANWASGYSSASWDIRHSFTTGFNYNIPFGKGQQWGAHLPRAADLIVGGWKANGILTLHTGAEYNISGTNCQGVWGTCRPDIVSGYVANQAPAGGRTPNEWFDINAYAVAAPLTGGDIGNQAMISPPTRTLDFSLFKEIQFNERWKLQFHAETFNLTNTTVLGNPDASLGDEKALGGNGNFGKITSGGTPRTMQFALKLYF